MKDKHYRALAWAVAQTVEWRGYYDIAEMPEYDRNVKLAREALRIIRIQRNRPEGAFVLRKD